MTTGAGGFTEKGQAVLFAATVGGLLAGFALAMLLPRAVRVTLFVVGPVIAIATYWLVNPDPGCTYECWGKLVWFLLLAAATLGWWVGLAVAAMYRARRERRYPR